MKKLFAILLLALTGQAFAADVSVTVSGQVAPGVYGSVTIGDVQPRVYVPQPVIIAPAVVAAPPLYLYVPYAHRSNWRQYCGRYQACDRQVYFVREDWVRERYEHDHGHKHDHKHDHKHGRGKGHDKH